MQRSAYCHRNHRHHHSPKVREKLACLLDVAIERGWPVEASNWSRVSIYLDSVAILKRTDRCRSDTSRIQKGLEGEGEGEVQLQRACVMLVAVCTVRVAPRFLTFLTLCERLARACMFRSPIISYHAEFLFACMVVREARCGNLASMG